MAAGNLKDGTRVSSFIWFDLLIRTAQNVLGQCLNSSCTDTLPWRKMKHVSNV
jgi:hypothetical protein